MRQEQIENIKQEVARLNAIMQSTDRNIVEWIAESETDRKDELLELFFLVQEIAESINEKAKEL